MDIKQLVSSKVIDATNVKAFEESQLFFESDLMDYETNGFENEVALMSEECSLAEVYLPITEADDVDLFWMTQEEDLLEELNLLHEAETFIQQTKDNNNAPAAHMSVSPGALVILGKIEDPELDEDELDELFECEHRTLSVNDDHAIASFVFFEEYFEFDCAEQTAEAQLECVTNISQHYPDVIRRDMDCLHELHQLREFTSNMFVPAELI